MSHPFVIIKKKKNCPGKLNDLQPLGLTHALEQAKQMPYSEQETRKRVSWFVVDQQNGKYMLIPCTFRLLNEYKSKAVLAIVYCVCVQSQQPSVATSHDLFCDLCQISCCLQIKLTHMLINAMAIQYCIYKDYLFVLQILTACMHPFYELSKFEIIHIFYGHLHGIKVPCCKKEARCWATLGKADWNHFSRSPACHQQRLQT